MISGKTDRVLDNPVWNALMTGNSKFAKGNEYLKYFDSEISPFAAMPDVDQINWEHLGKEICQKTDYFTQKSPALTVDTD